MPPPLQTTGADRPFDVITVPDFTGRDATVFEARTLVLLASWLENAAASRACPLHLACIGPPPTSIRRLAARCDARITIHQPLRLRHDHHVGNKFRGLEIEPETDRFLLLDVDTAILSDLMPLTSFGDCVAACPDDAPNVAAKDWATIYSAFGLPLPPTIRPLVCELDLPRYPRRMMGYEANDGQIEAMLPYYNGGVVFAPWACGLRERWQENILRIASLYDERRETRKWIHQSDQAALAVTIQQLAAEGWPFRRLPDTFNARWQHLYAGQPGLHDIAIMHCCWNFLSAISPGPVTADTITAALEHFFLHKVKHRFQRLVIGDLLRLRPWLTWRRYRGGMARAESLCRRLERVCHEHLAATEADRDVPVARAA
jgi:hypothetical protein